MRDHDTEADRVMDAVAEPLGVPVAEGLCVDEPDGKPESVCDCDGDADCDPVWLGVADCVPELCWESVADSDGVAVALAVPSCVAVTVMEPDAD